MVVAYILVAYAMGWATFSLTFWLIKKGWIFNR